MGVNPIQPLLCIYPQQTKIVEAGPLLFQKNFITLIIYLFGVWFLIHVFLDESIGVWVCAINAVFYININI